MRLNKMALALSTLSLAISGCAANRVAIPLRPDLQHPERMICEDRGARPHLPSEYAIDWAHVGTVDQAHAEHDAYVRSVRSREGVTTAYIVAIEGKLFTCSNNAQFWRDYWAGLPRGGATPPH